METKHLKTVEEVLRDEINSRTHGNWLSLCTEVCIQIGRDTVFRRLQCYSEKLAVRPVGVYSNGCKELIRCAEIAKGYS